MELGIEVDTPADLLNKANNIVLRHKELRAQKDELHNHVKLFNRYRNLFFSIIQLIFCFVCNSGFILGAGNSTLATT